MKLNGVKKIIILIITIVLCVCSCGYESTPAAYTGTQQSSNNTEQIKTSEPTPTKTQPEKTPVSRLRPFNPAYPLTELIYPGFQRETVREMTGNYSPYIVTLDGDPKAYFAGGYKDGKWYIDFDFAYNGRNYFQDFEELAEQDNHKEMEGLQEEIEDKEFISALINYDTVLKLYSQSGYIGEYKPAPMELTILANQEQIWYSNAKMELPEMTVGISHDKNPFPRKPVYIGDEGNFEIDLCGDGEIQKVVFHKVIKKHYDYYYFKIEVELIAYGKSYSITNYTGFDRFEESDFPKDPEEYFKEKYNNEYYNTIQILPIDLNGDGKMELVCSSPSNSDCDGRLVSDVYSIENNQLCYINSWSEWWL